uniref:SR-related and CTD-associated factor 4-like n=1 Tax=Styela clava TaxID=7725 RepID=UPI00193A293D|nr:SR-related and CTD-associated factor 4-like [Styela clava]XP_039261074.1 SR-related and CTD-associated factor 4-like [Styela clava]
MDAVKSFNDELSSIYETKPPVSRAKMTILTKKAIKGIKFYKHIVQSMEKFIQKCRPEYKVPGLYVIDSVVRQSRHQFGQEKDVFMPRLCKNILVTFKHLYKCPQEEKQRIIRVLNLWQKNNVFPPEIVQQLLVMGGAPVPDGPASSQPPAPLSLPQLADVSSIAIGESTDTGSLTNMLAQLLANPDNPQIQQLTGMLSNSQQAQLQALVNQVKGQQDDTKGEAPQPVSSSHTEPPTMTQRPPQPSHQASVFEPRQDNRQPPFLHSQAQESNVPSRPSFNRAILDYDYSDDESPKSQEQNKHRPGIDMDLLAKLPTVDQLHQITGEQVPNGNDSFPRQHQEDRLPRQHEDDDRRRRLEQEQEVFNKQIQQLSSEFGEGERSSQDDRSSRSTSRRQRSKSPKKRSRSRDHHRHRRRSRSRSRDRSRRSRRSRSRDRHRSHHRRSSDRDRRSADRDREHRDRGLPPIRDGFISLCSKTLWIGNLSSKVSQQELRTEVENHGKIESINMIPPRGCAYICMEKREEAAAALQKLRHIKIHGKSLKVDWAPGKEVKEEFKEFWSKEYGVNYIPLSRVVDHLVALRHQGFIDIDSVPEEKRVELSQAAENEVKESEVAPTAAMATGVPMAPMPGVSMVPGGMVPVPGTQGGMVTGPGGMPIMMRPAFPFPGMGQFAPQQRMPGFQIAPGGMAPRPTMRLPTQATAVEAPSPQKHEVPTSGSRTPTMDERQADGAQKAAAVAASIMSTVQPQLQAQQISMAQPRFHGPVQIRMMPGVHPHSPQVMQQRIGMNVMPIRMGMPMQFRPGFARVPMMPHPFQPQPGMQMQRMGQMMPSMPQGAMHLQGPMGLGPPFPGQQQPPERPPLEDDGVIVEEEVVLEDPDKDEKLGDKTIELNGGKRPPQPAIEVRLPPVDHRRPSVEDRIRMDERPPIEIHDRPPGFRMDERPPPGYRMDDRGPPGFRRSPPGRFGFDGRHPPVDGPLGGPRYPDRERFPDRDGRDDRRRDDMRRRDRSRSRERDRRDRGGMRDRRFERDDRDRFRDGGGRGRDRMGGRGRFAGRDDFGRGGRGGFGGFGHRDQFEEEVDEEDMEYKKKRDEVLRQRREQEDEYVVEEIDFSAFGLPTGFGPPPSAEPEPEKEDRGDRRRDKDRDDDRHRRDDRDRREDRSRRDDRDRRDRDRRKDDRDRRERRRSRDRDRDEGSREKRSDEDRTRKSTDEPTESKRRKLEDETEQTPTPAEKDGHAPLAPSGDQSPSKISASEDRLPADKRGEAPELTGESDAAHEQNDDLQAHDDSHEKNDQSQPAHGESDLSHEPTGQFTEAHEPLDEFGASNEQKVVQDSHEPNYDHQIHDETSHENEQFHENEKEEKHDELDHHESNDNSQENNSKYAHEQVTDEQDELHCKITNPDHTEGVEEQKMSKTPLSGIQDDTPQPEEVAMEE